MASKAWATAVNLSLAHQSSPSKKCDESGGGFGDGGVECGGLAAVCFSKQTHARRELANDFGSAVGRAIVHYKDFSFRGGKILIENAHDGLLDEALVVIGVNEDGDERFGHFHSALGAFVSGLLSNSDVRRGQGSASELFTQAPKIALRIPFAQAIETSGRH